jgi:hypothetical protein
MLRTILFILLLPLQACAPAALPGPEKQFVLVDASKYKSQAEMDRARQITEADCRTKALNASATIEKSIAGERHSMENLERARAQAAEMYKSSHTLCMLNAGYNQK